MPLARAETGYSHPVDGKGLLSLLHAWADRLRAHERYFGNVTLQVAAPVDESRVREAEARLECSLPPWLRDFYIDCAGSIWFGFDINDAQWEADGYVDSCGAELSLPAPDRLRRHRLDANLVGFTSDGMGNGWCFSRDDHALVWLDHDSDDLGEILDSFTELLDDPLERLVTLGRVDSSVEQLLRTGELPPP